MIGKTISHYKILEEVGRGGMGLVYKAEDTTLKRTVALKMLPPELTRDPASRKRFLREAQAASNLENSHICTIHEIGETEEGGIFMVMPCYEGQTLKEMIEKSPLEIEESVRIVQQVIQGLSAAHQSGVIHRDIKPANVFVTKDGTAKILDFGLAKLAGESKLTKTGTAMGTILYMSPEQTRSQKVDHRTDIWAVGILLYEMLTGRLPFSGDYEQAVIYNIANEMPKPITGLRTGIPVSLERIVSKCLEKDPCRRYQHVDEIAVDLLRLEKEPSVSVKTWKSAAGAKWKWIVPVAGIILASTLILLRTIFKQGAVGPAGEIQKKIVVLPFENLGHEEDDYFAEGVTEEITSRLASLHTLGVLSRQSARHYAGPEVSTQRIARELGVDYILIGTVRWALDGSERGRVRITPHLIRTEDDIEIWTQSYDHDLDNIFHTQSDIAQKVIDALGISLLQNHRESFLRQPTENMEAYQHYLRGRYLTDRPHFNVKDWENAILAYQKAVELDTAFALAFGELAKAHARMYYLRYDLTERRLRMADHAAGIAKRLGPQSPEVHLALGYYYLWAYRDQGLALEEWKIAEKAMPNNIDILTAKYYACEPQGLWEEAIRTAERVFALSPKDASVPTDLAMYYWLLRKYEKATDLCDQAILLLPDALWPYLFKAFIHWSWKGADAESRAALLAAPMDENHEWYIWSWYFQLVGERKFQEAQHLIRSTPGEWSIHKMWAMPKTMLEGFIHIYLGEKDEAKICFEKSIPPLREALIRFPDDPRYHASLGVSLAGIGSNEEAILEGKKAMALLPLSKDAMYGIAYASDMAVIYGLAGKADEAIEQIQFLMKNPSWYTTHFLEVDIRHAPLHGNPKFEALKKRYERK